MRIFAIKSHNLVKKSNQTVFVKKNHKPIVLITQPNKSSRGT